MAAIHGADSETLQSWCCRVRMHLRAVAADEELNSRGPYGAVKFQAPACGLVFSHSLELSPGTCASSSQQSKQDSFKHLKWTHLVVDAAGHRLLGWKRVRWVPEIFSSTCCAVGRRMQGGSRHLEAASGSSSVYFCGTADRRCMRRRREPADRLSVTLSLALMMHVRRWSITRLDSRGLTGWQ
jgi:hypothetical protein